MNDHTKRRKRRRAKLLLTKRGGVRPHRRKGGRTGQVQSKRTPSSAAHGFVRWRPNPPVPAWML